MTLPEPLSCHPPILGGDTDSRGDTMRNPNPKSDHPTPNLKMASTHPVGHPHSPQRPPRHPPPRQPKIPVHGPEIAAIGFANPTASPHIPTRPPHPPFAVSRPIRGPKFLHINGRHGLGRSHKARGRDQDLSARQAIDFFAMQAVKVVTVPCCLMDYLAGRDITRCNFVWCRP
jgi:hypothetical protein